MINYNILSPTQQFILIIWKLVNDLILTVTVRQLEFDTHSQDQD